jgi:hypothetical protein
MNGDQRRTTAIDARRAAREAIETEVTLRLETESIAGMSDNLSEAGIMFFTDQPIRCVVEVGRGSAARRYLGRIVRLQRMNETNTGLAVEFELE